MPGTHFIPYLKLVVEERQTLERADARALLQSILRGEASEVQLAALLAGLAARGETAAEIAGFVDAMRDAAVPYPEITDAERLQLVDTCGTGGDGANTFNISTAAALVAAAAGAKVAKHGNRAVTSKCGSADVLEALGIAVDLAPAQAAEALRRHGFAFLHAPDAHPAMRAVMPVRRVLGVRTVFNVLGPLSNPAGARNQVMGVYAAHLVPRVADAMTLLGTRHAMVVHGGSVAGEGQPGNSATGMDELALHSASRVAEVRESQVREFTFAPEDAGLQRNDLAALAGGDAAQNAKLLTAIFAGEAGPRRDVVLLNAAAVLLTAGMARTMLDGVRMAAETIDRGAVLHLVRALQKG